jgi:colicin import membrane protein
VSLRSGGGWSAVKVSVLLHGAVFLLAVAAYLIVRSPPPREVRLAIDATVVSQAPRAVARPAPPKPEPEAAAPVVPDPQVAREREAERKAAAARESEKREAREQLAQQEARDKAARDKLAREKAQKEKADKEKADKEKAAQEKLAREKLVAEQQRSQREADLNAQIAAEERAAAARASGQMSQYVAQITARIERAWIRPASAQTGLDCEVRVTQVPGGTVVGVQVGRCNGDESVRQSIESAVYRASPLPLPSDPALFERNLVVTFRPE